MQRKLLNRRQVEARTELSRWTIARLEKRGEFPKHVNIVSGCNHWFEDEVDAHFDQLAADRNQVGA